MKQALPIIFLLGLMAGAPVAHAETQLFAPENYAGWLDIRAASATGEAAWRDGGFGKLRYGGEDRPAFGVARAALLWKPRLSDTVTAHILFQEVPDARRAVNVTEAYVKWKPVPTSVWRYSARFGQMFPPVSLEHDGEGWTTTRTLTPSAINSWIGEEVLVDGLEVTIQRQLGDQILSATGGLFSGNDTAGAMLAYRGWALHDITSGSATELTLPNGPDGYRAVFTRQGEVSQPLAEVDGRIGSYLRLDWRPPVPVAFNLFFYDNPGNPEIVKRGQYGWTTRFMNAGLTAQLNRKTELLAQYLYGTTKMGAVMPDGRHPADIAYDSSFVMISRRLESQGRLSARLDYFAVRDFSLVALDNNRELGYSATFAWSKPVSDHIDVAVEAVHIVSDRPARITHSLVPDQAQTQIQLAFKLHL